MSTMKVLSMDEQKPSRVPMNESAENNWYGIRRFPWEIASISVHLEQLSHFWAKTLGISGSQWRMILALADLDQGEGAAVNAVSKMLHVDPSFVTTQSKLLEKKGFMRRKPAPERSEERRVGK